MANTATKAQIDFVNVLMAERQKSEQAQRLIKGARNFWKIGACTERAMSVFIDTLRQVPKDEAPLGMHVHGGSVYKVQKSKTSSRVYASLLVQRLNKKWVFDYAPGVVTSLSEDTLMDAEAAAKFGADYGVCCNCARLLTDSRSVTAGYGPVCAANNEWPWG